MSSEKIYAVDKILQERTKKVIFYFSCNLFCHIFFNFSFPLVCIFFIQILCLKNKLEYLVKWKNYGHTHNSWVPADNFLNSAALRAFNRKSEDRKQIKPRLQ